MLLLDTTTAVPDWTWLTQGGAVGILAAGVIAFVKGWIVSGSQYRQALLERERALDQVYKLADTAQRAIELAERRVGP